MNGPPALELQRVSMLFPATRAGGGHRKVVGLKELSAVLERGQVAALVGPNGSGKTTTLRMIATLVRPTSGRALVFGRDVVTEPASVRRHIGVSLGAGRSFYWRLSAFQNLAFFARLCGVRRAVTARVIARVSAELDIERYLSRPVRGLSRGTLARLSVARALMSEPELVLLDEPFASVDERSRELMWSVLTRRARSGRAVLIATHDPRVRVRCRPVVEVA